MGAVMRGEQTLRLIQLYHSHYPEIARNTQDADGRKLRTQLWQIITDELNAAYQTSFSVEQYKKKIQNVQCTSRQKAHAGKRSLGGAELEYLKLFEKDLLEPLLSGSDISREGSTHSRNSSNEAPSTPALPMEQLLEGFALTFEQTSSNSTDGDDKPGAVADGSVISAQNLNAAEQLLLALGQLSQQAMVNGTLNGTHSAEDDRQDLKPDMSNGANEAPKSPALLKAARKRRNGLLPNDGLLNKKAKDGSEDASNKLSAQMTEMLENQRRMLELLERQSQQASSSASPLSSASTSTQKATNETTETDPLRLLGSHVQRLCDVLNRLDSTLQQRFPVRM